MTSKKLLSALLALVFALSLFTALPVAAEGTVTATANGTAIQSGDTIPAVSTLVFTLPNAITQADLATAVTFEEIKKGKAAPAAGEAWAKREFDGVVDGNTLTVNFELGDLSMNSQYRFNFVALGESFTFVTNAKVDGYYINENFDRYPAHERIPASGTDATELDTPWWLGVKFYSRSTPAMIRENGDSYMLLTDAAGADETRSGCGSVAFDNRYAPASTAEEANYWGDGKYVAKYEFAIAGNPSSGYDIGPFTIKTDSDGKTRLYLRTKEIPTGSSVPNGTGTYVALGVELASPSNTLTKHTLEYTEELSWSWEYMRRVLSVKFDGKKVNLPLAEGATSIGYSAQQNDNNYSAAYHPIEQNNKKGLNYIFSVGNKFASANLTEGIQQPTNLAVYSYSYADYVPEPLTVSATTASGTAISPVGSLTFTFSEAINAATLATGMVFEEDALGTGTWAGRACNYALGADGKTLTVTFDEGDLAPNSNYRFRFTTAIGSAEASLAEETTFTYSTTAYGDYYVYDTFDRYKEWTLPTSPSCEATQLSDTPWYLGIKRYGRVGVAFAKVEGDTVLRVSSTSGPTNTDNYGCVSYNNAYSPVVGAMGSHTTVTEIEFTMAGNTTSVYEFGGIVIRTDAETGKTGLYYRTKDNIWGHQSTIAEDTVSLNFDVTTPNAVAARHTIKYVQTIDAADPRSRVFEKIWFDDVEVPMAGPVYVRYTGSEYGQGAGEDIVNLGGQPNLCQLFTATNNMASDSVPAGQQQSTVMDVYSYKCSPAGVNVTIAAGATAQAKSITIANNSGEAFTGVIALAVYDGDTLVGLDGLATTETVTNGQELTITRTVADAANGNTYKVIVLNNKNAVQPVGAAYAGIIG